MRVLQVLATSGGGVGRHVRDLATGLAAAGQEVRVAGPAATDAEFGFGAAGLPFAGVEIADRPRPVADARAVLRLRRLARTADVVHAHGLRAGALAVLATRALRGAGGRRPAVVVTLHNALVSGGRIATVHRLLERVVARADAVLGVSADLVEAMAARGARRTDLAVVPAPPLPPPATSRDDVRAALGVPDGAALLVTVARLAPQKGLRVLADALDALRRTHPDLAVHAVVAGDGPLAGDLRADAARRGLPLHLAGHRDDVADLLAAADVVVVPSLWEGQSLALREALRAGAAVVATDAGGNRAVAGDAAAFARPGEPADLAARLAEVLSDPAAVAVLRRNARERADSLPTASEAVRQVMTWYDAVATRPAELPRRAAGPGAG
jgi:glycosyltransferase involved in cell wall biosynthesis